MNFRLLILVVFVTGLRAGTLELGGTWQFALDPKDHGLSAGPETWSFPDTIELPGTTASRGKGKPLEIALNLDKPAMQHLHQRFPYIGAAWYQRKIAIPADWANEEVMLNLERVLWESRVWIDGKPVGGPELSLTTPHRVDLTGLVKPGGTHTLTLRVDNREMVGIGTIGHSYTEETQTIWNGVIGGIKLASLPRLRIGHVGVRTSVDGKSIACRVETINHTGGARKVELKVSSKPLSGGEAVTATREIEVPAGVAITDVSLDCSSLPRWSEHTPVLCELTAEIVGGHRKSITHGVRTFRADGRHFLVNGERTFLRGDLECATFPLTGHPDAAGEQWEKIMTTAKAHGLNHLRFHSWCPPEVAFAAADRHGIYLQVELPNWTFKMGEYAPVDEFLTKEGERILREYAHHPSFVMLSLGNELKGDLAFMDRMVARFRELEPDLLYTSTSYAFSPRGLLPGPEDDYFVSQKTKSGWVRGQGFLNETFPSTDTDYAAGLECLEIPLVSHEIGQYTVYPNLAELPKYENTPLRSTAMEAIRADLAAKGLLDDAARFTRDSGKLAALLYKEDIERALRTPDMAGFQLLQLQDFPGQSTATVGLLDAFWDSKGIITAEGFRQFCAPVVPLCRMEKYVWQNDEKFLAKLELANFGATPLMGTAFTASLIREDGRPVASKEYVAADYPLGNGLGIGNFSADLSGITKATRLNLEVRVPGTDIHNSWPVWVYPTIAPASAKQRFVTHRGVTPECLADLAAGKRVLLLPPPNAIRKPLPARFIPVFWSPLHFPDQPGTLGATIETGHRLWKYFPTGSHTDWQWWELTADSIAVDMTGMDSAVSKPFRFIDKFNRNALPTAIFEAAVGPGKLLVCTLDVTRDLQHRIVARQLGWALDSYISSTDFAPTGRLTQDQLKGMFSENALSISASSSHAGYPAANAVDGDTATIWHSDWTHDPKLPVTLTLDLLDEKLIRGLSVVPRQDQASGRIRKCQIQASRDMLKWVDLGPVAEFPSGAKAQLVNFPNPVKLRYLRLVILAAEDGKPYASCAEITPVYAKSGDVLDLGIVPGFNDPDD